MEKRSEKQHKKGKKFGPAKKFVVKKKRSELENEELLALEVKLDELKSVSCYLICWQVLNDN